MSFIQMGNVTVQTEWVAIVIALLLLIAVEKWVVRRESTYFTDIFFYYILTWKLSYVLFEFSLFVDHPMSLLYFHGGVKGHVLGIIVAILYLLYKSYRKKESLDWSYLLFTFVIYFSLYQSTLLILTKQYVIGALFIGVIVFLLYRARNFNNVYSFLFILLNGIFLAFRQKIFELEGWTLIALVVLGLFAVVLKEKHPLKNVLGWSLVIVLMTTLSFNLIEPTQNERVTNKAIDFELATLDGKRVQLSDYEGKKVILNFWATWCPPCKAEMPHLQKFYEEHQEEVELIAVNLASIDHGKEALRNFIEEYGLTFPIPLDENGEMRGSYEAFTIPTSYFIDSEGRIVEKVVGPMDEKMMERIVEKID